MALSARLKVVDMLAESLPADMGVGDVFDFGLFFALCAFLYAQWRWVDWMERSSAGTVGNPKLETSSHFLAIACGFATPRIMLAFALVVVCSFVILERPMVSSRNAKVASNSIRSPFPSHGNQLKLSVQSPPQANRIGAGVPNIAGMYVSTHVDADRQIQQLLECLKPTVADKALSKRVEKRAIKCIASVAPESHVQAIPCCNLSMFGACGGQPEIMIVVTCEEHTLVQRLKQYLSTKGSTQPLIPGLLIKTATKVLSDRLNFVRYWRTQIGSPECKTVHVVPVEIGLCDYVLYVHFFVNAPYPLRMHQLLTQEPQRCVDLMLLVKHWARERSVSNVRRGQFSLYTWCTLAMYFWRFHFIRPANVGSMFGCFRDFARFYADLFERDAAPQICFSVQVHPPPDKRSIPYIEDGLQPGHELSRNVDSKGMARVKEELQRACHILSRADSSALAELMERWSKP